MAAGLPRIATEMRYPMFRPVRTLILMAAVFFAGVFYERFRHGERCAAAGGEMTAGLCTGARG